MSTYPVSDSVLGSISFHLTLTTALQMQFGNGIPDKRIKTLASEVRSNPCLVSQRKLGNGTTGTGTRAP